MKDQALLYFNRIANHIGCQVVSSFSSRHIAMTKRIQKMGEVDVLALAIDRELQRMNDKATFTIVQIGANDGNRHDPYRKHIRQHGFRGVLVEPNPAVFQKLISNYADQPQLKFENAAIGGKDGEMVLYTLDSEGGETDDLSVYASLNLEKVQMFRKALKRPLKIKPITVPVITYKSLLERNQIEAVSLLALDTEGYDFEILKTIDFSRNRPRIIEFEHAHLSEADEHECYELLGSSGYDLLRVFGYDTIAILR